MSAVESEAPQVIGTARKGRTGGGGGRARITSVVTRWIPAVFMTLILSFSINIKCRNS